MAIYMKGQDAQLTANFTSAEFDCKCKNCKTTTIDPELVERLQQIRDHFGKAVTINSAYRCEKHNKSVGGASKSKHLYGQAADIKVSGVSPLKVAQYAESIGIKGIGQYSNFVHIDTRTNKFFWYGNGQDERSTFGKYVDTTGNSTAPAPTPQPEATKDTSNDVTDNMVVVTGATVNIRKGPGTEFEKLATVAKKNQEFKTLNAEGWVPILVDGEVRWISAKYVKAK